MLTKLQEESNVRLTSVAVITARDRRDIKESITIMEVKGHVALRNGDMMAEKLRERLAELEHIQWATWAREIMKSEKISPERAERWKRLANARYKDLTETYKDHDRIWANKVLKAVEKELNRILDEISKKELSISPGVWLGVESVRKVCQEVKREFK